jgi:hypothetical protein
MWGKMLNRTSAAAAKAAITDHQSSDTPIFG